MKKQRFKAGDRVKVISSADNEDLLGKTGVVTHVDSLYVVCVRFPGWNEGHSGETHKLNVSDRWYFGSKELKLIKKAKKKVAKKAKKTRK